jgi:hypothetical protein
VARKKPRNHSAKAVRQKKRPRRGLLWGGIGVVALAVGGALFYFLNVNPHPRIESGAGSSPLPKGEGKENLPLANYVGSSACASCHREETTEWQASQHHDAMAQATEKSVLGNFSNAKFTYAGLTSTFFKRDGKFLVNTDGPDGKFHDYEIKYTFGVHPLQQYLVEFPDGRLQALSIAWDSRPKKDGGQRWFHLYSNERITYDDELHWTRPSQNWNFMCADCHSTDVRKNYDPTTDKFHTHWAEINVGCEACHGPGSRHLEWAAAQSPPLKKGGKGGFEATGEIPLNPPFSKGEVSSKGVLAQLTERRGTTWSVNPATGNSVRAQPIARSRSARKSRAARPDRGGLPSGQTFP